MANVTMTVEEMQAELARLQQDNAALKVAAQPKERNLTLKIGPKGGVSVYGMSRFPVTLYRSQWERLISAVPAIQAFIEANAATLKVKE